MGTTVPQSAVLKRVIRAVLETNKTVTFAVKRMAEPAPAEAVEPVHDSDLVDYLTDDDI